MNNIIVIAPHADDEILGCGATIAKHVSEGANVYVIIATNANVGAPELYTKSAINNIRKEALNAHSILGVKKTIFLEYPAPALDNFPSYKISNELKVIFEKIKPKILYLPFPGDLHIDHSIIYRSSLVAARPSEHLRIEKILCYEVLSETEWSPIQQKIFFNPNYFVNLNKTFIDKKISAMECFASQIKEYPQSRSILAIKALSQYRGVTIGVPYAEAFSSERQIDK